MFPEKYLRQPPVNFAVCNLWSACDVIYMEGW